MTDVPPITPNITRPSQIITERLEAISRAPEDRAVMVGTVATIRDVLREQLEDIAGEVLDMAEIAARRKIIDLLTGVLGRL